MAHDASGGHDPEQPTLLYPEQQTSSIFQSYKSAIKNRRLEKSIPDVDSRLLLRNYRTIYPQAYGTVIPFSRENVLKMMPKITSSVKMVS